MFRQKNTAASVVSQSYSEKRIFDELYFEVQKASIAIDLFLRAEIDLYNALTFALQSAKPTN